MRLVVLGVEQQPLVVAERFAELAVGEELLLHPERASHEEGAEAARCDGEIRLEDALELEQRLVVEPDVMQVTCGDPSSPQAVLDGPRREARIALDPREPLFLRGGDDLAVGHETGGAVVIVSGNAEDVFVGHLSGVRAALMTREEGL